MVCSDLASRSLPDRIESEAELEEILSRPAPETVSVRWLAERFEILFGKKPVFKNEEMENALLSNASKCFRIFGTPTVPLELMIKWVAHWVLIGGRTFNKPTHFEVFNGRF